MPFGEDIFVGVGGRTGDTGQKYASTQDDVRQKFTGYQKDTETSLDFAEARMYENRFGRFTAIDPLLASGRSANPQTFNRYLYTGNNPIVRVDRNGEDWIIVESVRMVGGKEAIDRTPTWVKPGEAPSMAVQISGVWALDSSVGGGFVALHSDRNSPSQVFATSEEAQAQYNAWSEAAILNTFGAGGTQGASDATWGTLKGIGNAPVDFWNGLSYTNGPITISNPFQISQPFPASNKREQEFASAGSTGIILGTGFALGAVRAPAKPLSVVPEEFAQTFPPIKPGSAGGPTAEKPFSQSVRADAFAEDPTRTCVYCRQQNATQVDHAIPRANGGNATIDNAQLTCSFCNPSKGSRQFPVNPAPGYEGPFPPPWW